MTEFYENIEEPIRDLIRFLRDNGFNTTCSYGHKMYIELDFIDSSEIEQLFYLLFNNGYRGFKINASIQSPPDGFAVKRATVHFNTWM